MSTPQILKKLGGNLLGSAVLAFGLYQVHAQSSITEGGILGCTLLLQHWLNFSPALSGFLLNALCYLLGWRLLGKGFLLWSAAAGGGFSLFYAVFERFPPLWPELARLPLAAALLGAVFVGLGVGLCVRCGGAPTGDDALAMSVSRLSGRDIRLFYLAADVTVLLLSLSYLEVRQVLISLLSVILSGQLVGLLQPRKGKKQRQRRRQAEYARSPARTE